MTDFPILGGGGGRRLLGRRGSTRFPTPMVESFSADFLPATGSYWTELHLERWSFSAKICGAPLDD